MDDEFRLLKGEPVSSALSVGPVSGGGSLSGHGGSLSGGTEGVHHGSRDCLSHFREFLSSPTRLRDLAFLAAIATLSATCAIAVDTLAKEAADFKYSLASRAARHVGSSFHAWLGDVAATFAFSVASMLFASIALLSTLPSPAGCGSRHAVGSGIPEMKVSIRTYPFLFFSRSAPASQR